MEFIQNEIEIELDPHIRGLVDYLLRSIRFVYINDSYLLEHSVHEQSLSHRLAYYFENMCRPEYYNIDVPMAIDTEYNKNFDRDKEVFDSCRDCNIDTCFLRNYGERSYKFIRTRDDGHRIREETAIEEYIQLNESKKTRPDIILHHRGDNEHNIIVIEAKRNISFESENKVADLISDLLKLSYYTCHPRIADNRLNYRFGIGCSLLFNHRYCDVLIFRTGRLENVRYRLTHLHDDVFRCEMSTNDDIRRRLRLEAVDGVGH